MLVGCHWALTEQSVNDTFAALHVLGRSPTIGSSFQGSLEQGYRPNHGNIGHVKCVAESEAVDHQIGAIHTSWSVLCYRRHTLPYRPPRSPNVSTTARYSIILVGPNESHVLFGCDVKEQALWLCMLTSDNFPQLGREMGKENWQTTIENNSIVGMLFRWW